MLTLTDTMIPSQLQRLPQPPKQLFVRGESLESWAALPKVAIVGSRKYTHYGRQVTEQFTTELAREGVVIISGLALGIDALAHEAALLVNGRTVAVLPGPLERIYPSRHRALAQRIVDHKGSLVSEHPPGTPIYKYSFIARNRIIAGLADAVLIPEAGLKSGSLHTARFALEQGITVLAVPGSITSPSSEGTNNLIKSGAVAVTNADDVLLALGYERQHTEKQQQARSRELSGAEKQVYQLISSGTQDQGEIMGRIGLSAAELTVSLTSLEINGFIAPLGGGRWMAR